MRFEGVNELKVKTDLVNDHAFENETYAKPSLQISDENRL